MKVIYVAGPYTAESQSQVQANIARAEEAGKCLALMGYVPMIPHKNTAGWDACARFAEWTHGDWMQRICLPILSRCDGILMIDGWQASKGALMEYDYALSRGMPIFDGFEELAGAGGVKF